MQGTLETIWFILVLVAAILAIIMGYAVVRFSRDTKKELKEFKRETGREYHYYSVDYLYLSQHGRLVIRIVKRFDPRIGYVFLALLLIIAWALFWFSGLLSKVCLLFYADNSLWHMSLSFCISLGSHIFAWLFLSEVFSLVYSSKINRIMEYYGGREFDDAPFSVDTDLFTQTPFAAMYYFVYLLIN